MWSSSKKAPFPRARKASQVGMVVVTALALGSFNADAQQKSSAMDTAAAPIARMPATAVSQSGTVRIQLVREAAISAAMRTALAKQSEYINRLLDTHARQLDDAYDFGSLMLTDSVVPPVIRKVERVTEQSGDVLQYSAMQFKIIRQASFATRAPTWRTYLPIPIWVDLGSTHPSLLPTNSEEKVAAQDGLNKGWTAGSEQANAMFFKGLTRLQNDWVGMLVYHALLKANMVTAPIVNRQNTAVSGGSDSMTVDQSTYRIEAKPVFNPNISQWLALLDTSGTASLLESAVKTPDREAARASMAVPSFNDLMQTWSK